jgi:FAD:protein FMN transferase
MGPLKKNIFIIGILSTALLSGCRRMPEWKRTTFLFFDTICQVQLQVPDSEFETAKKKIHSVFSEIQASFTPGAIDYSSTQVIDLFQLAAQIHRRSNGDFDISVAPLSELWGFRSGKHTVPSPQAIQDCLKNTGLDKIKIQNSALIVPEAMELDWGGIAKGWGIDLAYQECKKMNIPAGFINAGGDLYCWGSNPDQSEWRIGITHPRQTGFLGILQISGIGAATTGDYQRCFFSGGRRYHHIFNPDTGRPARGKQSVTVIGPSTAVCDGLATALFVSPEPKKILSYYPEYGAILVLENGQLEYLGQSYSFQADN